MHSELYSRKSSFSLKNVLTRRLKLGFRKYEKYPTVLLVGVFQVLGYFSLRTLCSHFYPEKGPRPKWTIHNHESDKNKGYLSVGDFGILSVVCCYLLFVVCGL